MLIKPLFLLTIVVFSVACQDNGHGSDFLNDSKYSQARTQSIIASFLLNAGSYTVFANKKGQHIYVVGESHAWDNESTKYYHHGYAKAKEQILELAKSKAITLSTENALDNDEDSYIQYLEKADNPASVFHNMVSLYNDLYASPARGIDIPFDQKKFNERKKLLGHKIYAFLVLTYRSPLSYASFLKIGSSSKVYLDLLGELDSCREQKDFKECDEDAFSFIENIFYLKSPAEISELTCELEEISRLHLKIFVADHVDELPNVDRFLEDPGNNYDEFFIKAGQLRDRVQATMISKINEANPDLPYVVSVGELHRLGVKTLLLESKRYTFVSEGVPPMTFDQIEKRQMPDR